MRSLSENGLANGRSIGFLILFALVIVGIFVMNRWIKTNLVEDPNLAVSAPSVNAPEVEKTSSAKTVDMAPEADEPVAAGSQAPRKAQSPSPQENKIIYETPLNSTILVQ